MSKRPAKPDWLGLIRNLGTIHEVLADAHRPEILDEQFRKLITRHFPGVDLVVLIPDEETGRVRAALATGALKKLGSRSFSLERMTGKFGNLRAGRNPRIFTDFRMLEPYSPLSRNPVAVAIFSVSDQSAKAGLVWAEFGKTADRRPATVELLRHAMAQYAALHRIEELDQERQHLSNRLNSIITHANAAIVIIDDSRRVQMMNPVAEELTGYRESEVLDTDAFDIVVVDARYTRWAQIIKDVGKGKTVASEEVDLLTKDGSVRHCLINAASIPSSRPGRRDIVLVAIDITEKTDLERRMIQSERLVTLGEMAAGIVHELNNPLSVLSGASDMLIRFSESFGAGSELATRPARFMRESLDRIQSLARTLMNYARPTAPDEPENIDVNQSLESALSFSEYELSRDGVRIETRFASSLPRIRGSQSELQQVFLNLLQNARQAMKDQETPRRIRVTTARETDGRVKIEVADSGPGIPDSLRPRIFEPFFTSRKKAGGSGLGLYIVKNIVQRHRGEVSAGASNLGGAAFTVLLPAAP